MCVPARSEQPQKDLTKDLRRLVEDPTKTTAKNMDKKGELRCAFWLRSKNASDCDCLGQWISEKFVLSATKPCDCKFAIETRKRLRLRSLGAFSTRARTHTHTDTDTDTDTDTHTHAHSIHPYIQPSTSFSLSLYISLLLSQSLSWCSWPKKSSCKGSVLDVLVAMCRMTIVPASATMSCNANRQRRKQSGSQWNSFKG